jgi:hypothetical protein
VGKAPLVGKNNPWHPIATEAEPPIDEDKTPLHERSLCYIFRNSQPDSPKILKYDA